MSQGVWVAGVPNEDSVMNCLLQFLVELFNDNLDQMARASELQLTPWNRKKNVLKTESYPSVGL